jgi:hypothetical protein
MKLILSMFEQLSGLKINFHKSEIFCFGKAKDKEIEIGRSLVVRLVPYQSDILVYQFTIGNLEILSGIQ